LGLRRDRPALSGGKERNFEQERTEETESGGEKPLLSCSHKQFLLVYNGLKQLSFAVIPQAFSL
jgi:hypothetical protein